MSTCGTVVLDNGALCVDPRLRPSLPGALHEQRRPGSPLGLCAHHSLTDNDIFVVEVLSDTAAKLENDHVFIILDVVSYRRPALIS